MAVSSVCIGNDELLRIEWMSARVFFVFCFHVCLLFIICEHSKVVDKLDVTSKSKIHHIKTSKSLFTYYEPPIIFCFRCFEQAEYPKIWQLRLPQWMMWLKRTKGSRDGWFLWRKGDVGNGFNLYSKGLN